MVMQTSTSIRAAVLEPGRAHYGGGRTITTLPDLWRDLRAVLDGTLTRFEPHSTVIVDGHIADLQPPDNGAWSRTKDGPWTLWRHAKGERTVAIGARRDMTVRHLGVLFDKTTDPGITATLLDKYAEITGAPWRGTCATTAHAAIRLTWENSRAEPLWNMSDIGPGAAVGALEWERQPGTWETTWGYVHQFDANAAYLGAAINAELAWSGLFHTGPQMFDEKLPGYWLLQLDTSTLSLNQDPARPPLFSERQLLKGGCAWVTTPYAKLLAELGDRVEVLDSHTARPLEHHPAGSRALRKWGEQMRDARLAVQAMPAGQLRTHLEQAVKRTYKDAIGGMQRAGMRVNRADWGHTVVDHWRATLYRTMMRIRRTEGIWPVRVATDSLAYADGADTYSHWGSSYSFGGESYPAPLKLGTGLGQWKHDGVHEIGAWVKAHPVKAPRVRKAPTRATSRKKAA